MMMFQKSKEIIKITIDIENALWMLKDEVTELNISRTSDKFLFRNE